MIRLKYPVIFSGIGAVMLFGFHWSIGVLFFVLAALAVWVQDRFTWK